MIFSMHFETSNNKKKSLAITMRKNLLEKLVDLCELERSLTRSLETAEPWLQTSSSSSNNNNIPRVRPIPTTMDQVEQVLAVARNFSNRTSAPAGWNPNAPLVGFSTPNPLPHQLRGGVLAALELQRARETERDKKRKREVKEEEEKVKREENEADNNNKKAMDIEGGNKRVSSDNANVSTKQDNGPGAGAGSRSAIPLLPRVATNNRPTQPVVATTMNLSDSSSEEEEEDSDSE